MKIEIVNITTTPSARSLPNYVYAGRSRHEKNLGNPFSHEQNTLAPVHLDTRDAAVQAFREWLSGAAWHEVEPERRRYVLAKIDELAAAGTDIVLGCFCVPERCHTEVLREFILEKFNAAHR